MVSTKQHSWREAILVYTRPRVIGMLFLGFQAGLPFLLIFSTLTAWLNEHNVSKTTIGFFAWVGITYSIKFFWAPVIDRLSVPVLSAWLGHRRGWMLLAMSGVAIGLVLLAQLDPKTQLTTVALTALFIAFSSATQDVVIDAYRIEAIDNEYQAAMAGMYQAGWRIGANIVGFAFALFLADIYSWQFAYTTMACFVAIGITTVMFISEPKRSVTKETIANEQRVIDYIASRDKPNHFIAWLIGAVVCPFVDFFKRNSKIALIILLFIGVYRISDIALAVMATPFYLDMGFSLSEIAFVTKIIGIIITILGALTGGIYVVRYGIYRCLFAGAIMVALANLLYAVMTVMGHDMVWFTLIVGADNFSGGFASSAFIAYLSSLTNRAYTATQYALFSSLMTLFPKIISGFSGLIVDQTSYLIFFIYVACLGIPGMFLVLWLMRHDHLNSGTDTK